MARKKKQINKNRLTPEQQRQKNEANIAAIKKGYRSIEGCIKGYYQWAGNLPKGRGRRTLGRVAPAILLLGIISIASGESTEPKLVDNATTQVAVEPIKEKAKANLTEPNVPKVAVEPAEKETKADLVESDVTAYPVTIVKTGEDFQYTYSGELKVYADKAVIEATWQPECGDVAPVDFQTHRITYTLNSDSSTVDTTGNFSDCFGKEGVLKDDSDPYQVDSDGTIRVDLIEPSDGSLVRKDFIVITGGPTPSSEDKVSRETNQTDKSKPVDEQYASEPQMEEAPIEKTGVV